MGRSSSVQRILGCFGYVSRVEGMYAAGWFGWVVGVHNSTRQQPRVTKGPKVPHPTPPTLPSCHCVVMSMTIYNILKNLFKALPSQWRGGPWGLLDCVLRALWALRPCDLGINLKSPSFQFFLAITSLIRMTLSHCFSSCVISHCWVISQAGTIPENSIQYFTMMSAAASCRAP